MGYFLSGGDNINIDIDAPGSDNYREPTPVRREVEPTQYEDSGFLLRGIDRYQREISPRLHERVRESIGRTRICRYEPSCSEYARGAIGTHGSLKGSAMAAFRLLRCNPLSKGGYDPVS